MHHDESVRSPFLHHTDVTSHETTTLKPDDDDDAARGWTPREDSSSFATQKHAMRHFPRYFYHIVDTLNSCQNTYTSHDTRCVRRKGILPIHTRKYTHQNTIKTPSRASSHHRNRRPIDASAVRASRARDAKPTVVRAPISRFIHRSLARIDRSFARVDARDESNRAFERAAGPFF